MPVNFIVDGIDLDDWSGTLKEIWDHESKEYTIQIINSTPYHISNITPEVDPRYVTITGDPGVISPGGESHIKLTANGKAMYEDRKSAIPLTFKYTSSVSKRILPREQGQ